MVPMPPTVDRRPFCADEPAYDGYLEGDGDWCDNNRDAVAWLIENHKAIREALEDAARWRALIGTPYMRPLGWAGFDTDKKVMDGASTITPRPDGYMHFGVEFTSVNGYGDSVKDVTAFTRNLLTLYADTMRQKDAK